MLGLHGGKASDSWFHVGLGGEGMAKKKSNCPPCPPCYCPPCSKRRRKGVVDLPELPRRRKEDADLPELPEF